VIACAKFETVASTPTIHQRIVDCHQREDALYRKYRPWASEPQD
jgi:hypothetical protein